MSWSRVKLHEVCTFMTGGTPSKAVPEYFDGGDIPWIVSGDVHRGVVTEVEGRITTVGMENSPAKFLPLNSVLIALNGQGRTRATVALLKLDLATCNQSIVAISPKSTSTLHHHFLFAILRSMYQQLRDRTGDDKRSGLNIGILKNVEIPLPPLAEQKRIAAVLDKADELRSKRRQALATLDTLLQSVFLDMFGDPVTNPKGWPTSSIGDHMKVLGGYAFKSEDFSESGLPVIRISNLARDNVDLYGCARIPETSLGNGSKFRLQSGDTLIAMSGATTGKLGFVPDDLLDAWYLNQRVGAFRVPEGSRVSRSYLRALLQSPFYQTHVWNLAAGAAQPNISGKQLESARIPVPPADLQQAFTDVASAITAKKTRFQRHLAELDNLFAALQSAAFAGTLFNGERGTSAASPPDPTARPTTAAVV